MKQLIQYKLDDGSTIVVEGVEPGEGLERISRGKVAPEQAEHRFAEALARVRPAAEAVLQTFQDINTPAEINLEFGITFNAKAGVIIASIDSEATFKVALKWTNKSSEGKDNA